jgi:hypothetical protein
MLCRRSCLTLCLMAGLVAGQFTQTDLTPEAACGQQFHVFGPPMPPHTEGGQIITREVLLSGDVVAEGLVVSKRTDGPGVQNDVRFHIDKLLRCCYLKLPGRVYTTYPHLVNGDIITIHVDGGYSAGQGDECNRDDLNEGARIVVGKRYLAARLTKEAETEAYRSAPEGTWFRIAADGSLIPTWMAFVRSKSLTGETITSLEKLAKERLQTDQWRLK